MAHPATRAFEYYAYQYRRVWRGSVFTSLVIPLVYLAAMGLGVGALMNRERADTMLGGVSYLDFLAPGLLAASVAMLVVGECTWPVFGQIKWDRTYFAMIATPLRATDALLGNVGWIGVRAGMTAVAYFIAMAAFGVLHSPWSVAAIPATVLTGLALATPTIAFAASRQTDASFALLFRFGTIPMFLFSGTFFPVGQLPAAVRPVAWLSPLWHGVELDRSFTLGTPSLGWSLLHVAYLAAWLVAGLVLARRVFVRRLIV